MCQTFYLNANNTGTSVAKLVGHNRPLHHPTPGLLPVEGPNRGKQTGSTRDLANNQTFFAPHFAF